MSTPVAVASVIGAFVLGLLLGAPLAYSLAKRRLARALTAPVAAVPEVANQATAGIKPDPREVASFATAGGVAQPEPTKVLDEIPTREPRHAETHVITSVGEPDTEPDAVARKEFTPRPQLDQVVRTVLIEAASVAHGVRSALSEENRAKIQYEIKRELIRVRRTRKTEVKQALAEYRAKHRAPESGEGS